MLKARKMEEEKPSIVYRCLACKSTFTPEMMNPREIRCPYCGYKVLEKVRKETVKMVKAI